MSFDVNWDIDKYKEEQESDDHWQLRRKFMESWKPSYPEERLVCLSRVFANIEFMGCRYPQGVMQEVARMSEKVNKKLTSNKSVYRENTSSSLPIGQTSQKSTSAELEGNETIMQGSVSIETPVNPHSLPNGFVLQGYEQMWSQYWTEAMQKMAYPNILGTPYCNNFYEGMPYPNSVPTGGIPGNMTQQSCLPMQQTCLPMQQTCLPIQQTCLPIHQSGSSESENFYQNNASKPSWHNKDPRIKILSASDLSEAVSQPDGIQSLDMQINDTMMHVNSTNVKELKVDLTPGPHKQTMSSGYDENPCEMNNIATASCSQQNSGFQFAENYTNNGFFENNFIDRRNKNNFGKGKLIVGDMKLVGSTARRYAYWMHAGKGQQEALRLSKIPIKHIPEYKMLKKTLGSVCQLKRLKRGDQIPEFKRHPKGKVSKTPSQVIKEINLNQGINVTNDSEVTERDALSCSLAQYRRYTFWKYLGKSEEEAKMLFKLPFNKIPLAMKLKERATKCGHPKNWKKFILRERSKELFKVRLMSTPSKDQETKAKPQTNRNSDIAEITTVNEDPDISEITTMNQKPIVVSDDEDTVKKSVTDTSKTAQKIRIAKETQMKRFDWWMRQGKSEEEATILSQNPMAISDALHKISESKINNKDLQEVNLGSQNKEGLTQMSSAYSDEMQQNLASEETHQRSPLITNLNLQCENFGNIELKNSVASDKTDQFEIYIKDANQIGLKRALMIQDAIAQCIISEDNDDFKMPTCGMLYGYVIVICSNEQTRDWLDKQIPTLEPWEGAQLNIVDKIEISRNVQAGFLVPAVPESDLQPYSKSKDILEKLHQQNPNVGCNKWVVIGTQQTQEEDRFLNVRFDNKANTILKSVGYKLKWYSRIITVKLRDTSKITKNIELQILDPPNKKDVSNVPLAEDRTVDRENTTLPVASRSIIGNKDMHMEISDDLEMSPIIVYPDKPSSSNSLPRLQGNKQAALNCSDISALANLAQASTSAENSTRTTSIVAREFRQDKVENTAGSWGIDTPCILLEHMAAIACKTDLRRHLDRSDGYHYGKVIPFSGRDENYSVEEKFAARRQNCSLNVCVFNEQTCLRPDSGLAEPAQEYFREKRVFDEQETTGPWEDRVIQDYPLEERSLTGKSHEHFGEDRLLAGRNLEHAKKCFDEREGEYSRAAFDERHQEYSREIFDKHKRKEFSNDNAIQDSREERFSNRLRAEYFDERDEEYSRVVIEENERTDPWADRVVQDSPQEEGAGQYFREDRVCNEKSNQYSGEARYSDKQNPDCSGEGRFDDRDPEYSRNDGDMYRRRQEYSPEVIDNEENESWQDQVIQVSQEERGLDGRSHEYSEDSRYYSRQRLENSNEVRYAERGAECSRNDKGFEEQHQKYYGEGKFDDSNAGYSRNDRVFDERRRKYSDVGKFDEPGAECSRNYRVFDGQRRKRSRGARFDERGIKTSEKDRGFHRDDQNCMHESGLGDQYQYSRNDRDFNESQYSREHRDAGRYREYTPNYNCNSAVTMKLQLKYPKRTTFKKRQSKSQKNQPKY